MKEILVPTDFSEQAEGALRFAQQAAQSLGAEICLFHTINMPHLFSSFYLDNTTAAQITKQARESTLEEMELLKKKYSYGAINIKTKVFIGSVIEGIEDYLAENEPEMIVMGTNGASGIREMFIGSNCEKVVRIANCPVFSLPNHQSFKGIRDIVIPTDMVDISEHYFEELLKIHNMFNATLHFVWINTPHVIENEEIAKARLQSYVDHIGITDYTISIRRDIMADAGILRFTDEIGADLIAMATHGNRGIAHLFSGSLAEDIVNHSLIPVWTYNLHSKEHQMVKEYYYDQNGII